MGPRHRLAFWLHQRFGVHLLCRVYRPDISGWSVTPGVFVEVHR